MRFLNCACAFLIAGFALSVFTCVSNGAPPTEGGAASTGTIDLTATIGPAGRDIVDRAFVDYDQLVSTNNPQWTMFGTNPPPSNNMCTFDMADTACGLAVGGARVALARHDHIIDRIHGLTNQDGSLSGIVVGISGYYGTYTVAADRATAIRDNYTSYKIGAYRTKYNAVFTKKQIANEKADAAGEQLLSCTVFPRDSTQAQQTEAVNNLMTKVDELNAANAALLSALNSAVSTANSLKTSSNAAAFPNGTNFGGMPLEQIWVAQGMLYWWYIGQGYVDRGHYVIDSNGDSHLNVGWPYGTPPSEQPSTFLTQQPTVLDMYQYIQPEGGFPIEEFLNGHY